MPGARSGTLFLSSCAGSRLRLKPLPARTPGAPLMLLPPALPAVPSIPEIPARLSLDEHLRQLQHQEKKKRIAKQRGARHGL